MADKRNFKIVYSNYSGTEKKAIEFIYKEMGEIILRDSGRYQFHVMACENENNAILDKNAVIIGKYSKSKLIQKFVKKSELKENGYLVKAFDNPDCKDLKIIIITALESRELFYAAADFIDDFLSAACPRKNATYFPDEVFSVKLPDYTNSSAPYVKTRSVFTWAHPINDYISYIETLARNKINEIILWNDFLPINSSDIINLAHEYGIKVIWGFSWGWGTNCKNTDLSNIDSMSDEIIKKYEEEYLNSASDGIYFQSFTELSEEYINGKLIAEAVTDLVNKTAEKLLCKYPNLKLQFGLHATSVKEKLSYIKNVDKRVTIIWEDCGAFPFSYKPEIKSEEEYEGTKEFINEIINLRENCSDGVLYKGLLTMDWVSNFVSQVGPYVLGVSSESTIKRDREIAIGLWRGYTNSWMKYGKYAYLMTENIITQSENSEIGLCGQLSGGVFFPFVLASQILWDGPNRSYEEILDTVSKRKYIDFA